MYQTIYWPAAVPFFISSIFSKLNFKKNPTQYVRWCVDSLFLLPPSHQKVNNYKNVFIYFVVSVVSRARPICVAITTSSVVLSVTGLHLTEAVRVLAARRHSEVPK